MKLVKANSLKEEGTSHNPEVKKQVILRKGDLPPPNDARHCRFTTWAASLTTQP